MTRRILRTLLFAAVGLAAGFFVASAIIILGAAIFWLFIFGDDPWPGWAEDALVAAAALVGLGMAAAGGVAGWRGAPGGRGGRGGSSG